MKVVSTTNAPAAIGPYSQALDLGNMVFVSGQIPVDPATGVIAGETIVEQAKQVMFTCCTGTMTRKKRKKIKK